MVDSPENIFMDLPKKKSWEKQILKKKNLGTAPTRPRGRRPVQRTGGHPPGINPASRTQIKKKTF